MAYEIDFIGVDSEKSTKDADAICLRWQNDSTIYGTPLYKIGVVDGGFEVHGEAMVNHMNQYYFDDKYDEKDANEKVIDFMVVTHPDKDHTTGLKKVLDSFNIKKIYMNRPWLYVEDLFDKVNDGRITIDSLYKRLREKYSTIADIEDIAKERNIPIYEAFNGTYIENNLLILSPSKQFYLDLLVESEKTPLTSNNALRHDGIFANVAKAVEAYVLKVYETLDIETLRENVTTSAENETSVVIRGIVDGSGFLLTGDAGIRALNRAINYMEYIGESAISDVSFYQIPHHGSRHNVSPSVLNRMLGKKNKEGDIRKRTAIASVAKDSDHPLKMVTNAFVRRGVIPYKTQGGVLSHHNGDMPDRGWSSAEKIEFSNYVEEWDD